MVIICMQPAFHLLNDEIDRVFTLHALFEIAGLSPFFAQFSRLIGRCAGFLIHGGGWDGGRAALRPHQPAHGRAG